MVASGKQTGVLLLTKFNSDEYLKGDSLIADYQGNISICGNEITFSHLEFDEEIKININNLILCKDKEISIFYGKNDDDTTYKVDFKKLNFVFSGCVFNKNAHCNPIENSSIEFDYCTFKEHFRVNDGYYFENQKIKINDIIIKDSVFEKDFTVYKAEINMIEIKNVDFESLSEFNEVTFQDKFDLQEITYKGFTLFDNCIFNTKAKFEYIIFEKFTSFRSSIFNKGLNLDFTSADKEINFFGIKGLDKVESKNNTSQETYRIIKYNFDKIGNKIEANNYLTMELEQHRNDIWKRPDISIKLLLDGIVSALHWISSNHSSNWFIALFWIFMVSLVTNEYLNHTINIECLFKYINILSKIDDFNESYTLMILNKVSLGYLYYQFLTAVRKDTRK